MMQSEGSNPIPIALTKVGLDGPDVSHGYGAFKVSYDNGKMDGFNRVLYGANQTGTYPYQYVDPAQLQPLWAIARQYVLADHMFQTQASGSFTAHQDLIRGNTALNDTQSVIDNPSAFPWGCDAPPGTVTSLLTSSRQYLPNQGPRPCFYWHTMRDLLDAKRLSWKYYAPSVGEGAVFWNAFDAIHAVRRGPEWATNISTPEKRVFADISSGALPAVSWIVPDSYNSDHLGENKSDTGPSWVAAIVNAVGGSAYWNSTAIVVVWDDWGGLYDGVRPPQLAYDGLGFRVPCLIVSPYARIAAGAKAGYISHTQYEFGSILRFVEDTWTLGSLGTSDARATSIADAFDFTQAPRAFVPIAAKYSRSYFEHQAPSGQPVDNE
jgi:phospholipase C